MTVTLKSLSPCLSRRTPERRRTKQLATTGSGERRLGRRWLAENERKSESHAQAQLADRAAVDGSEAHGCVEGEFVVHLPYGSDETRERLRLGDDTVRIDFKNRSDFPFARALDDSIEKELAMLIGR